MITHWTVDEIEKAKKLLDQGLTAAQIAAAIRGRTRNSVIGMFHRLKIRLNPKTSAKETPKRLPVKTSVLVPKRPKVSKLGYIAPAPDRFEKGSQKPTYKPLEEDNFERLWEPVTFDKLNRGQCRWIIGEVGGKETLYCGEPVAADIHKNRSWCQHHYLRVFPTNVRQTK